jgi:hypothetical protein
MYNLIPGNTEYKISLERIIVTHDDEACTLPVKHDLVQLELYGELGWYDRTWLSLIAHFEINLPMGHQKALHGVRFVPINKAITCTTVACQQIFDSPIVIDGLYRVIPGFTNYAVSEAGEVIDLPKRTKVHVIPPRSTHYPTVDIYNPDKVLRLEQKVHRLVALAWLPNNDYVARGCVNHIDGDKSNYHLSNLEWCSYSENALHAFEVGLRTDNIRCRVRDVYTREIMEFASISQACGFMGVKIFSARRLRSCKRPSKLIANRFELREDGDGRPWFYENLVNPICPGRYTFKITHPTRGYLEIHDVRKFRKEFGIHNVNNAHEAVDKAYVIHSGIKIDIVDHYNDFTDKERRVRSRDSQHKSKAVCILAVNQLTNEHLEFPSLTATSQHWNVDRCVIKRVLLQEATFKDWLFKEIVIDTLMSALPESDLGIETSLIAGITC